jgi:hypothetical protein
MNIKKKIIKNGYKYNSEGVKYNAMLNLCYFNHMLYFLIRFSFLLDYNFYGCVFDKKI